MRVIKNACARTRACVSVCVVSESEVFGRRHATPQCDRGFIDWGCGGGAGEGVHAFLQGIFLAQGLKSHVSLCLLHWQAGSLP